MRCLGFEADDELKSRSDAAFFAEDHGACFADEERSLLDCKASRAAFVEHSISQRLEEERKNEQRKAEIVPISFS